MNIVLNKPDARRGRDNMGEEPGKLFIGAVSSQVSKEEFQAFFEKFGEVSDIVLMIDKDTNRNRGFGFVTFKDPSCATKILSSPQPLKLHGRALDPKPSVQRGQLVPPPDRPPQNRSLDKKVFVGGVSQSTDDAALKNYFNSNNYPVKEVVLMHDNLTLKSRGFGFVTFLDDATVESVCRQRFFNIDNKTVECKKAEPRGGKHDMGPGHGGGPGGPGGNFNQMQRGGPHGGGPNMGGGYNQGWNQNPNYGNNQFNQGGGNYGQQGGWGGQPQQPPMGNYGQQPQQQQQQQGGFMPRGGTMPNQGGFGGQYNNGNAGYNQQRPQPQQGGYGYNQQQPQQQQPQQQQQPLPQQQPPQQQQQPQGNYGRPNARGDGHPPKSPRFAKSLGQPQNYNSYGNYGQQQPSQQQQQPDSYRNQAPAQTNQGYNTGNYGGQTQGTYPQSGNMGNYPQEASGYGPQRVNYNQPQTNFTQPQGGGYGADMSGGFTAPAPQQQQQQQQQQPQQHQQQTQQQNYQPQQDNTQDMYSGGPAAPGNFARGGNNAALPFHPYRR
ncbi:RNA-binding protein Musashi homolog 2-like isoform X2 [Patiria miniata]|uniref:RRM domain-containing protein n=1 Tax=Patiria miniata TaxID=46514 RepID=A0A914BJQ7_PATMI|nr:RNA-binding protein Musashi homolog 2-like isoform X2 [Patiria miniata]